MTSFNWLHLTDFHRGMKEHSWPNVKDIFFDDLERLHDKCGPWDLVLFTGDLTQKGSIEEFKDTDSILNELWKHFKKLGSDPKLLAVPGNHDLARPNPKDPSARLLRMWDSDTQEEFWSDPESPYRHVISKAFENYAAWHQNQPCIPGNLKPGMVPGDFSCTIEKQGFSLGILGLNTAFLQLTGDDYKGKLALHTHQFHQACDGDGPGWVKQHNACVLMTHHPPAWLDSESQKHLNGEITCRGYFTVHLCGHLHEARYLSISDAGTETRRIFQSRSLFGFEHYRQDQERLHGYTAGSIEISGNQGQGQGSLFFWPRKTELQGEQRSIVPDYSMDLNDDQHTVPVIFKLNKGFFASKEKSRPGKEPVGKEPVRKEKPHTDKLLQDEIRSYWEKAEALHENLPLAGFKTQIRVPDLKSLLEKADQTYGKVKTVESDVKELKKLFLTNTHYDRIKPEVTDRIEELLQEHQTLFVGRESILKQIDDFINQNHSGFFIITGQPGFGKTALLANWITLPCQFVYRMKPNVICHFFSNRKNTNSIVSAYQNLLYQLHQYYQIDTPLPYTESKLRNAIFRLVSDEGAREYEPLIFIFDALDEADTIFTPPFPTTLKKNIFVIASARADKGENPAYLEGWTDKAEHIHIDRLTYMAIADWLKKTDNNGLIEFIDDHFVKQIEAITGGFPLYLYHLTEDIAQAVKKGDDIKNILDQMPQGFEKYVEKQLDKLDELELPDEKWNFLALLTVTKGPLNHNEIKLLTGMKDRQLRKLRRVWQVTRWFSIQKKQDTFLYGFSHPLLAKTGSLVIRVTVIFIIKQHVMIFSVFSDNLHNCSNPLPS